MKRSLGWCFVLAAVLAMLSSCGDKGKSPPKGQGTESETASFGDSVKLDLTGYTIIVPERCSEEVSRSVSALYKAMRQINASVKVMADTSVRARETNREILIGNTNRSESQTAISKIQGYGYSVESVGNKLILCGQTEHLTKQAVESFLETSVQGADSLKLSVRVGYIGRDDSYLKLIENGKSEYKLLLPKSSTPAEQNTADAIRTWIKNKCGVELAVDKADAFSASDKVIAIGIFNGVEDWIRNKPNYANYSFGIRENNVYVIGYGEDVLFKAAEKIEAVMAESLSYSGNSAALPTETAGSEDVIGELLDVPVLDAKRPDFIKDCGNNCYELIYTNAESELFRSYADELLGKGYAVKEDRNLGGNLFKTVADNKHVLNLSYHPTEKTVRLICEEREAVLLPENVNSPSYEQKNTMLLTQLGMEQAKTDKMIDNGMGYTVLLEDGRFLIIDGGNDEDECADRLMQVLRKQAPDPQKIEIAAWIFTHAHEDHVGTFLNFSKRYADSVSVGVFLYNFPCAAQSYDTTDNGNLLSQYGMIEKVQSAVARFRDAKTLKVHAGYRLQFGNAQLEFLYTPELFLPTDIRYFNVTSLVFRMTNQYGQSVLFTGDHSDQMGNWLGAAFGNGQCRRLYGDYLESDVVQVLHHGFGGGAEPEFYTTVKAKYVLWPCGKAKYEELKNEPRNAYMQRDDVKDHVYVAGDFVTLLEMTASGFAGDRKSYQDYLK